MGGPPGLVGLRPVGPPPSFGHPPSHRLPPPHMRIRGPLPPRGPPPMGLLGAAPPPRELISVPTAEEGVEGVSKRSMKEAGLDTVSLFCTIAFVNIANLIRL